MNTLEAKIFFNNLYSTIWISGKLERFPDFYHPDVKMKIGEQTITYQQIFERAKQQKSIGKRMEYHIHTLIAEDDRAAIHISVKNYLKKNLMIMAFFQFKDDKIYHAQALSQFLCN